MNLPYHPAPGLGDLLPGYFVVPQNPVTSRDYGVTVKPGIGDVLPAAFSVPENPILNYVSGKVKPIGQGASDGGCGCGGGCGSCGSGGTINGMGVGDLTADWNSFSSTLSQGNIMGAVQSTFMGIPVWLLAVAAVAVPMLMQGGGGRGRR